MANVCLNPLLPTNLLLQCTYYSCTHSAAPVDLARSLLAITTATASSTPTRAIMKNSGSVTTEVTANISTLIRKEPPQATTTLSPSPTATHVAVPVRGRLADARNFPRLTVALNDEAFLQTFQLTFSLCPPVSVLSTLKRESSATFVVAVPAEPVGSGSALKPGSNLAWLSFLVWSVSHVKNPNSGIQVRQRCHSESGIYRSWHNKNCQQQPFSLSKVAFRILELRDDSRDDARFCWRWREAAVWNSDSEFWMFTKFYHCTCIIQLLDCPACRRSTSREHDRSKESLLERSSELTSNQAHPR